MAAKEILFTVNSPGEVSTWLAPAVAAVNDLAPDLRVSVMILPCLYASGTEVDVIRRMAGVDVVVGPKESFRYIMWGRMPASWRPAGRGVVVYLGGELFLAARLGRRLGYPVAAYTEGYINTPGAFSRVFVPRESARAAVVQKGVSDDRVEVVGDLMVDAADVPEEGEARVKAGEPLELDATRPVVALFPGSRPHELRVVLPLFVQTAASLAQALPQAQFVVALSPYTTREMLASGLKELAGKPRGKAASQGMETPAAAEAERDHETLLEELFSPSQGRLRVDATLTTPRGKVKLVFWRGPSRVAMAAATLALTIPGSNTAELAAWGVPMIVCLPLERPEEIPLDGVLGYIDKIPVVGRKLKAKAVLKAAEKTPFVALPNRIAGTLIAPELRSTNLRPEEVARQAEELLGDPAMLREMSERLVEAMGPRGAAAAIVRQTVELIQREARLPGDSP